MEAKQTGKKTVLTKTHFYRKLEREQLRIFKCLIDSAYVALARGQIGKINQAIDLLEGRR